jgi:hypothetical protein
VTGRRSRLAMLLTGALIAGAATPSMTLAQSAPSPIKLSHLQGQVVDSAGHPVRSALVESADPARAAISDDNGYFRLSGLPAGSVTITVRRAGFIGTEFELRLPPDSTVGIGVKLLAVAQPLEATRPDVAPRENAGVKTSRLRVLSDDNQPVVHANVAVEGGTTQITDERGEMSLGHGTRQVFTVSVRRIGYQPWFGKVDFADTTAVLTITLQHLAQTLSTVTVTGRSALKSSLELNGFYDRWMMRQKGTLSAVFIGPEELEFRHPDKITNMLYGLNGVKMVRIKGDYLPFSTGAASMSGAMCPMAIVIDGQQVPPPAAPDKLLDANDVNAIEVYNRGGNMPISMQFNDTICGVIAFWTGSRRP